METNPHSHGLPKSGRTEETIWSLSTEYDQQSTSSSVNRPYSYTCTFCKKGFSNAQALGGHMNIHRRDRAKLRQSSSSNTNASEDIHENPSVDCTSLTSDQEDHNKRNRALKQPSIRDHVKFHGKDDKGELQRPLPLFVDRPAEYVMESSSSHAGDDHGRTEASELDLELRLGLEPGQSTPLSTWGSRDSS
ncbi:hypothetical protein Ancab_032105 [Ancistrocladus abbreviatus]